MSQMTMDEQASYNLASILCQIPKRKLISDFSFIIKEFNVSAITNYVIIYLILLLIILVLTI